MHAFFNKENKSKSTSVVQKMKKKSEQFKITESNDFTKKYSNSNKKSVDNLKNNTPIINCECTCHIINID